MTKIIIRTRKQSPPPEPPPVVKPPNQLWRVMHDYEICTNKISWSGHGQLWEEGREWDWRAGYPEVFWCYGTHEVPFDEAWQRLTFAQNNPIQPLKWREVFDDWRAFMNRTGFDHRPPSDPYYTPRRDYINQRDLSSDILPAFDKVRVCGGATISGVRDGAWVYIDTLDVNNPPSLDWLRARPWFTFHAVSNLKINGKPVIDRFPQNGANPTQIPLVTRTQVKLPVVMLEQIDYERTLSGDYWNTQPYKIPL